MTDSIIGQEAEHDVRLGAFAAHQVNAGVLVLAGPQAFVIHCRPAHWGEEITEGRLYSPQSVVFGQAKKRLRPQTATLAAVMV